MDPIDRSDIDRLVDALSRPHGAFTDSGAIELIKSLTEALADARIHPADPLSDPRVVALVDAAKALLFAHDHGNGLEGWYNVREKLRAALRAIGGEA